MLHGFVEYLLLFPIIFIIGFLLLGESQVWIWLAGLLGLFFVGVLFKSIFSNQKWWVYTSISLVVGVSASFLFNENLLPTIILALIHPVFVYRGIMYASHSVFSTLLPVSFMWLGGFGIYFVSYFIFRYAERLYPFLSVITFCGLLIVIIILFISNSEHLKASTLSKQEKPFINRSIKSQNHFHLIITLAVIAFITMGQKIREWIWNGIRSFLQWIFQLFPESEGEPIVEEQPSAGPMDLGGLEKGEPSAFFKFLEMIAMYAFYVFIVVAAIVALLLIIKKTRDWVIKIFRKILTFLKNIVNRTTHQSEAEQYIDEKESVFNWDEWKEEQKNKAKGMMQKVFAREPRWEKLSNEMLWIFSLFYILRVP